MKDFSFDTMIEEITEVEKLLSKKLGPFLLFALFQREDALGKWDIVVSAKWIEKLGKRKVLDDLAQQLQMRADRIDVTTISRIVILDPSEPVVKKISACFRAEHKNHFEIEDSVLFGLEIKHAFVVTSRKETQKAKKNGNQRAKNPAGPKVKKRSAPKAKKRAPAKHKKAAAV